MSDQLNYVGDDLTVVFDSWEDNDRALEHESMTLIKRGASFTLIDSEISGLRNLLSNRQAEHDANFQQLMDRLEDAKRNGRQV